MTARLGGVLSCLAAALSGCGRYGEFTLPVLAGRPASSSFAFAPQAAPVLSELPREALNPSIVRRGSSLMNLYSVFDGARWSTALAVAQDSNDWQKKGMVLTPDPKTWEGSYIAANGSALLVGEELWYWYEAGEKGSHRIGLARNFRKLARPVLDHGPYMSWDERAVADPCVVHVGSYFYMYYLGQDRAVPPRQRLGVARSTDGIRWEKLRTNPILELGEPGAFDENGLGEPAVWQSGEFYWMLYTGRDAGERRRLGLARSTDGTHWHKLPSVFEGTAAWNSQVVCDPSVLVEGGRVRVWFGGGDVARPDENIHGQIGYGLLTPISR